MIAGDLSKFGVHILNVRLCVGDDQGARDSLNHPGELVDPRLQCLRVGSTANFRFAKYRCETGFPVPLAARLFCIYHVFIVKGVIPTHSIPPRHDTPRNAATGI